jgi:hypothetical protein
LVTSSRVKQSKEKSHNVTCFSLGTGVYFLGVKWPQLEADHSPPFGGEVKDKWSETSNPPVFLHGKDRENFSSFN